MEHRALMCTSQAWKGPKGSTFSPNWDNTSYQPTIMMSPCPDVVKSPCQHAAKICHPPEASVTSQFQQVGPHASTSTGLSAMANTASRRGERECYIVNPIKNEETALPAHNPEFRRRSFSAATASNSIPSRNRCDSYDHRCPDNSSEDISRGDASPLSPDVSPDHGGPRSRSRSIILRKTKRRPAPPTRSVSLRRDSASQLRDNRTKSLYMDRDTATQDSFLPDLILISTPRTEEELGLEQSPAQPVQALVGPPVNNNGQLGEVRSTDRCSSMSSSGPAMGITGNEDKKAPSRSESVRPPPPLRHPPSLICKQSPFQPPAPDSPSSDQSNSQCETSPPPILMSSITGPSPLGCRMRPKSSTSPTSPRARTSRLRLSLELPGVVPLPDPTSVKSKATRRHSESSGTTRPRQRLSSSMMVMPVVTQEDLSNVRLRSVSSSDSDKGLEGSPEVIREEEQEQEQELESCPLVHHSPKAKPPVAAKPPAHKWPPIHMVKSSSVSTQFSETLPASPRESQGNMFMVERRAKPKRSHQPPCVASDGVMFQRQQAVDKQQYEVTDSHPPPASYHSETRDVRRTSPTSTTSRQAELDRKKKLVPPPVAKKPDVLFMPSISSLGQESTRSHVWSGLSGAYQVPASAYQPPTTGYQVPASSYQPPTTGYQVPASGYQFPASAYQPPASAYQPPASAYQPPASAYQPPASAYQPPASVYRDIDFTGQDCNHHRIRDDENSEERKTMPQMRTLCLSEQEEEVFDHNSSQPTTEDLFTIIHRSKKKLLGGKETADSAGSRQGYGSPSKGIQRDVQKSTSKNDNFMAFLQRRRSNKPSSGERLSASELLKNTKPLAGQL
ncbi:NHS-like protein 2 [Coregonus clupeaformis]|uniref:NHS-like protein 2 n=1 Tax=Coregonus clupeaformis TaxID=59861 RepID=UPI001BDFE4FC|nr:NHS-like protein 2 [Coregonus clupeaformis]XP_041707535.1 NHS-like protein 2 [Coregonus clupeaformis]